jgi:anti-sigma B factor antagonist
MTTASSHLEIEAVGDVTVVNFTDKKLLDEQTIQIIGEQLLSLADEQGRRKILLNFGNVEYLSSAFVGVLATLNAKVNGVGGRLILCNIDPLIYEVFESTKLSELFNIQREEGGDDPEAELGGVRSRLIPPKPTRGQSAALRPPPPPEPEV